MREIRFKAWDEEKLKWFDDYEIYGDGSWRGIYHKDDYSENCIPKEGSCLVQYIGLKDRNGIEIKEFDILKHIIYEFEKMYESLYQVVWEDETARFVLECISGLSRLDFRYSSCEVNSEIIGNILEGPELFQKIQKVRNHKFS